MRTAILAFLACCIFLSSATGQQDKPVLPSVTAFECPTYPPEAKSAHLQGTVTMQVTTDGHQVADVKLTSGHPLLVPSAVKNVRTWKFAEHSPTTFAVTYSYSFEGDYKRDPATKCAAKMELPTKVKVSTRQPW
jgi:hypothetical protein